MGSRLHRRVAAYLPPLVLLLVALAQIYLTQVGGLLTPSKGGGYGLFSTVDKLPNRQLRIYLVADRRERPIAAEPSSSLHRAVYKAMSFPTRARLDAIARQVASQTTGTPRTAVHLELWKTAFDPNTWQAKRVKVRELTREVGRDGR